MEKSNKLKIKFVSVMGLCLGLFCAIVVLSVHASSQGSRLLAIEREMKTLESQNKLLREKTANQSSLVYLSKVAQAIDFTDPSDIVYLGPVADSLSLGLAYANQTQNR